ncbi:hypothetical protein SESBI_03893 [Sesbania bispinosa]|nr:hypothetical protein SESBI_03893 [Sesbania bispinosa]
MEFSQPHANPSGDREEGRHGESKTIRGTTTTISIARSMIHNMVGFGGRLGSHMETRWSVNVVAMT